MPKKTKAPNAVSKWCARIGRKGGRAGSAESKRKAAMARWSKEHAKGLSE